jgi:hypothetical protein
MRRVITLTFALVGLSCGQADSSREPAVESAAQSQATDCERCFMLFALGKYLKIPTRYDVRRSAQDGCLVLTAPFSILTKELGTTLYAERLRTESGLVRYCDRAILDRDITQIQEKSGPGTVWNDGEISVHSWSSDQMKTPFTATYFVSKDEGLLIFDVDRNFAKRVWREGIRN